MLKRSLWLVALAALGMLFAFPGGAKADTVYVDGSYAFANGGYGIPPYGGTLNGQSEQFYCVDFSTPIWGGESWQVTVTSLTGSNFSLTKLKNQTSYLEMAWLITQMMSTTSQLQQAMDQYAIWSFTGGPNPYGSNSTLVAAALAAVNRAWDAIQSGTSFDCLGLSCLSTPTECGAGLSGNAQSAWSVPQAVTVP